MLLQYPRKTNQRKCMSTTSNEKFIERAETGGGMHLGNSSFFQPYFFFLFFHKNSSVFLWNASAVSHIKSTLEPLFGTITQSVKGQNPSATKQTRRLISGLAVARLHAGCAAAAAAAGTESEIKARLVAVDEDSLLGD